MVRPNRGSSTFETIERLADIPDFQSEDEEHAFWATHEFGKELLDAAKPLERDFLPPARKRTKNIAVRFDEATLQRVRNLAERRNQGYQTLIKQFVVERLYEEEKRDGTIS